MSDRPSSLFFLMALTASSALAALVSLLAPDPATAKLLGNGAYFVSFATCSALLRRPQEAYHAEFLAGFLIFGASTTMAFLYGMTWEPGRGLAPELLRRPLNVIGYVSSAPDSWPPLLAIMWMATVLPVTLLALLAGRAAAQLRGRRMLAMAEDRSE